MKILSWNVNWIRAVIQKWFFEWVNENNADIICLQEVKAFEIQIPSEIRFHLSNYDYLWHKWERPGYAWTAIFFRKWLDIVWKQSTFEYHEFSDDGRVTELSFKYLWNTIHLLNVYFPNWWNRADWTSMLPYKLDFYEKIRNHVQSIRNNKELVIICWDFNICHTEIDIARPKENEGSIWFLPEEREEMSKLWKDWLVDIFRELNPWLKDQYTWWSYRWSARERNVWRRIDYFWTSPEILQYVKSVSHQVKVSWSDHCPIMLELN